MYELTLTDIQREALAHVAADAAGWPLDDAETLGTLRRGFARAEPLLELRRAITAALAADPAVLIHKVPVDSDVVLVSLFQAVAVPSGFGNGDGIVYTVAPSNGESVDISTTDKAFPPHTDSTFLREPHHLVALACVECDSDAGGYSTFLDVRELETAIVDRFGDRVLHALSEPVYPFTLRDPLYGTGILAAPIIDKSLPSTMVRYRRDVVERLLARHPGRCEGRHIDAFEALNRVLDDTSCHTRIRLVPGDLVIIDNRRALHGRTAIRPGARRVLRRLKGFAIEDRCYAIVG